jgi:hypothetical protein
MYRSSCFGMDDQAQAGDPCRVFRVQECRSGPEHPRKNRAARDYGGRRAWGVACCRSRPQRGEVWVQHGARFGAQKNGVVSVESYRDAEWALLQEKQTVKPYRVREYDLDALLSRPVIVTKHIQRCPPRTNDDGQGRTLTASRWPLPEERPHEVAG